MKKLPNSLPPRYKSRFNDKLGEFQFKKRFRYTDPDGKVKDTDTRWHLDIESCEKEAREKIEGTYKVLPQSKLRKEKTMEVVYSEYLSKLHANATKKTNIKNSTAIDNHKTANALYNSYFPDFVKKTPVKEISAELFSKWLAWINSDTVGHQKLSGVRIRAFKGCIKGFAEELISNGLIDYDTYIRIVIALKDQRIKKRSSGKRNDRYMPTFDDLQKIKRYYRQKEDGLGKFENFYWYTFWIILFCTGMRPGEIVALQWRDITFAKYAKDNVIHINNAINEKENRENEMAIIASNNLEAKNKHSIRNITMWAYYRELFMDYKHAYRYWYGYESYEDMEEQFVFPNITSRKDKTEYQSQKNLLREINRVAEAIEIPKTDVQMFRHACAYFLAYERNYPIEDTHDFFGHTDSSMIREVYAPLNAEERRKKQTVSHHTLITEEDIYFEDKHSKTAERVVPGKQLSDSMAFMIKEREKSQILKCIEDGFEYYYYPAKHQDIVETIIKENPGFLEKIKILKDDQLY